MKKDKRYTISREFCGAPCEMYVLRFCDDFIGAYMKINDAKQAKNQHILTRHEAITGKKIESITGHRKPTPAEIRRGYGATHYREFPVSEWVSDSGRFFKHWIKADDGLRYYR